MFMALPVARVQADTVDISVKAVAGYPLIDNLPENNTPPHTVWFGVFLLNEGTEDTYCNVTIYLNMTKKFFVEDVFVADGSAEIVIRNTNTSDLGKGAYAISALAEAAGDVDPGDNYKVGDTMKIGMVADVNYDGKVDIYDVTAISSRFGISGATLSPVWIPEVDFNLDGKIDIMDVANYASIPDYYNVTRCIIAYGSSGPHGPPEWSWACDLYSDGKIDMRDISIAARHYGEVDP